MNEPNDPSSDRVIAPTMITSGRRPSPTEPKTRWTGRCVNSPGPDRSPLEAPMFKKLLTATVLVPAALIGLSSGASAHTPQVSHSCTAAGATLTVHLVQYEKGSTVTVSGQVQASGSKVEFGTAEYKATFNLGDGTSAKTWKVEIDNRGDGMNKADKFDSTFTDVVAQCVLTDLDLTPQPTIPAVTVPPQVEYIHPATPPCVLDGRFDANTPECEAAGTPVVVLNPPEVLERAPQPPVLAFTGSTATTRAIQGAAIFAIGLSLLYIGRRFKPAA